MLHVLAPAKLNLYLRVLGKRPDGYHEIETVFERIDLADELTFEPHQDLVLTCTDPTLSCGEDNLVVRAARLLQQASGGCRGARIQLAKRIPIAAGLGGGSSDAAATLLGLSRLWELGWDATRLIPLAARLGADVPFFFSEAPMAVGRGRGEVCEPMAGARRLTQLLVVPSDRLSTKDIYAQARFDLTAPKPSITMMQHALCNGSLGELARGLWNDLAPEAIRRCPVIATIQSILDRLGCVGVCVSGSGPAVFGLCADMAQAEAIAGSVRRHPWRVQIVQTWRGEPASKVSVR